jgi:pyrroline-5-carboxylate reductase
MTEITAETVGFIGCGTLTEAVITAIRRSGDRRTIVVSPRSQTVSRRLAAAFAGVERAASNAEVVARADIVVLAVRPQQLDEALDGLAFSPEQTIVSFVAKLPLDDLRRRVAPAHRVCRVTPLPMIAIGRGPVVVHPVIDSVVRLFAPDGRAIVARSEDEMMAFGYASSLMSTHLELQATIVDWLERRGVAAATAFDYVTAMFDGLAATAAATAAADRAGLPERHETPGGLNARCRATLAASGWFAELATMLDRLEQTSLEPRGDRRPSPEEPRGAATESHHR